LGEDVYESEDEVENQGEEDLRQSFIVDSNEDVFSQLRQVCFVCIGEKRKV